MELIVSCELTKGEVNKEATRERSSNDDDNNDVDGGMKRFYFVVIINERLSGDFEFLAIASTHAHAVAMCKPHTMTAQ